MADSDKAPPSFVILRLSIVHSYLVIFYILTCTTKTITLRVYPNSWMQRDVVSGHSILRLRLYLFDSATFFPKLNLIRNPIKRRKCKWFKYNNYFNCLIIRKILHITDRKIMKPTCKYISFYILCKAPRDYMHCGTCYSFYRFIHIRRNIHRRTFTCLNKVTSTSCKRTFLKYYV